MLVEEISPTVDNFGVYIDNYHCDVNDKVSCPRTLIVRHETQEVLIKTIQMAPMKVQVSCGMVQLAYVWCSGPQDTAQVLEQEGLHWARDCQLVNQQSLMKDLLCARHCAGC